MSDGTPGWIGVDFDGTLAISDKTTNGRNGLLGPPVPLMLRRVKNWLRAGRDVRIFTARITDPAHPDAVARLNEWMDKYLGRRLPITSTKDYRMDELWDDRAFRVEKNTGRKTTKRNR